MEASRTARDIMVKDPATVKADTMVFEAMRLLLRRGISGAPVVDQQGNYRGVLSEKGCMRALLDEAKRANEVGATLGKGIEARHFMKSRMVTFGPDTDALEAVEKLLAERISGAPVLGDQGRLLGVFSERYSMSLVLQSAIDGVPSVAVSNYMNTDMGRLILEDTDLLTVARIFLDRYYRRLCVEDHANRVIGLIARRDVLQAAEKVLPRSAHDSRLSRTDVATYMDRTASTVGEGLDLLGMAQIFLNTNYRRLPVLREGRLVGQVSRRDLLAAADALLQIPPTHERSMLYLSAVRGRSEVPPIE